MIFDAGRCDAGRWSDCKGCAGLRLRRRRRDRRKGSLDCRAASVQTCQRAANQAANQAGNQAGVRAGLIVRTSSFFS